MPRTDDRFFFAPCKNKAVRAASCPSSWAAQTTAEIKDDEGVQVGELRKLRYKKCGVLTDWLMDEYSSSCGDNDQQQQFVFCKVYVSPRAAPSSDARHESAAFFALPPLPPATPAAIIAQSAAKRTAPPLPQAAMPPCAKRTAPPPQAAMPPCAKRTAPPPQAAMPPCAKRMRGPVVQPPAPPAPTRSPVTAVRKLYFAPPQPCAGAASLDPSCGGAASLTNASGSYCAASGAASSDQIAADRCSEVVLRTSTAVCASPWFAGSLDDTDTATSGANSGSGAASPDPSCVGAALLANVSVQSKQRRILDPFEAAILREQAEEQTVAAAPEPSPYKQFPAAAPALQDDDDDLVKDLEDAMSTAEAEEQTVVAALQDEDEDDNWDDLAKELEIEE
ncbi:uncharacterized protein [Miscanthus floridulus]|uniref:uncharacterized protein n=1 Tax=Miscanthus floridulus TaxID=154761 RepID=UPI003458E1CB